MHQKNDEMEMTKAYSLRMTSHQHTPNSTCEQGYVESIQCKFCSRNGYLWMDDPRVVDIGLRHFNVHGQSVKTRYKVIQRQMNPVNTGIVNRIIIESIDCIWGTMDHDRYFLAIQVVKIHRN